MAKERRPLMQSRPEINLGHVANRAMQEGVDFLDTSWLNNTYSSRNEFALAAAAHNGDLLKYTLDTILLSPLIQQARENEAQRPPYGLITRTGKYINGRPEYAPVQSFPKVFVDKNKRAKNAFHGFSKATEDTLVSTLVNHLRGIGIKTEADPASISAKITNTFMQLEDQVGQFTNNPNNTPLGQLFNGIGTGTKAIAGIQKVIPELVAVTPDLKPYWRTKAGIKHIADNSFPLAVEFALLDKTAIVEIQEPLFKDLLEGQGNYLKNFVFYHSGDFIMLDVTDKVKIKIENLERSPNHLGCPFMAAVEKDVQMPNGQQQRRKIAGVTELWWWMRQIGDRIYDETLQAA